MPISLLLQEITGALRYAGKTLAPWSQLMEIEERLIDRARSLFLVKWFGRALPLRGFHLRIAFANLAALQARYTQMDRQRLAPPEGPNLTEPLAGMAGALVGAVLSPGAAIGLTVAVARKLTWAVGGFLDVLVRIGQVLALIAAPFGAAAVAGLSPALALGGAAYVTAGALQGSPGLRGVFDILGATARALVEAAKFVALLLGPAEKIQNPVLRAVVSLIGLAAKLFPFVLALGAEFVSRFAPMLAPLAGALGSSAALAQTLVGQILDIATSLVVGFKSLFEGNTNIVSPLQRPFEQLQNAFRGAVAIFRDAFAVATRTLTAWGGAAGRQVGAWTAAIGPAIKAAIKTIPTVANTRALIDVLKAAADVFAKLPSDKPAKPAPPTTSLDFWIGEAKVFGGYAGAKADAFPNPPGFETLSQRIERLKLRSKYNLPEPAVSSPLDLDVRSKEAKDSLPPIDKAVSAYVERARHPASFFAGEQAALARDLGVKTPAQALEKARSEEMSLREVAFALIDRVLPRDFKDKLSFLPGLYATLDDNLKLSAPAPPLPVKHLAQDEPHLAPRVGRMIVRAQGADRDTVSDFVDRLRAALKQPLAPAPA